MKVWVSLKTRKFQRVRNKIDCFLINWLIRKINLCVNIHLLERDIICNTLIGVIEFIDSP